MPDRARDRPGAVMLLLAISLAVVGAGCYAFAAHLQHHAVRAAVGTGRTGGRSARWAWQRRWLAGQALIVVGALVHATALGLAPLTVIQPIGVLAVAMTTVLYSRSVGSRPGRPMVLAVLVTTLAVGGFVALAAGSTRPTLISSDGLWRTAAVGAVCIVVLAGGGALTRGRGRSALLAAGGGIAYGFVSVCTRMIVQRLGAHGLTGVSLPAVLGLLLGLGIGVVLVQFAYVSGAATVVVGCLTVVDPLFAVGAASTVLGEGAATPVGVIVGQVVLALMAAAGVALLARFHPSAPTGPSGGPTTNTGDDGPPIAPAHPDRPSAGDWASGRLRIVLGADTYWPDVNGAARFCHRLAGGLAVRGHDVHVLCPAPDGRPGRAVLAGVTVHRVRAYRTGLHRTFRICPPWQAHAAADTLLTELAPDLVHVQAHFVIGRALTHAAARRGVPLVATNHFMPENLFGYLRVPGPLRPLLGRLAWRDAIRVLSYAELVTAPTPRAVQLLRDRGLDRPVEAISCGVDLHRFTVGAAPASTPPTVLFVGRLDEEKRVDELLRAVATLPAGQPVHVDIVGEGTRRAGWQALAERLGIAGRVTFHGLVPEAELPAMYERCALFCMPGAAELQSLATMEAMAAGRPVVAADAMALPHLVRHGHNGWLYPPGDISALAARLASLLADPARRAAMGAASRQLIAGHSSDATVTRFEALYHQVLSAGRGSTTEMAGLTTHG